MEGRGTCGSTSLHNWLRIKGPTAPQLRIARSRRAAFVDVNKCEHCVYFGTSGQTGFFFAPFQSLGDCIILDAFSREFVPYIYLVFLRPASFIERPSSTFVLASTLLHSPVHTVISLT